MTDIVERLSSQIGDDVQKIYDHEALFIAARAEIIRLRAKLAKADALADALESNGNVTERHCRALHALIAYREADT